MPQDTVLALPYSLCKVQESCTRASRTLANQEKEVPFRPVPFVPPAPLLKKEKKRKKKPHWHQSNHSPRGGAGCLKKPVRGHGLISGAPATPSLKCAPGPWAADSLGGSKPGCAGSGLTLDTPATLWLECAPGPWATGDNGFRVSSYRPLLLPNNSADLLACPTPPGGRKHTGKVLFCILLTCLVTVSQSIAHGIYIHTLAGLPTF